MSHNALLSWPDGGTRYAPEFMIGSEADDGSHMRDTSGWPYSIYREGIKPGVGDMVLCHGIQDIADAQNMLAMVNGHISAKRTLAA
jgi:hypothetical protein